MTLLEKLIYLDDPALQREKGNMPKTCPNHPVEKVGLVSIYTPVGVKGELVVAKDSLDDPSLRQENGNKLKVHPEKTMVKQELKQTISSDVIGMEQTILPVVLRYPDVTIQSGKCQVSAFDLTIQDEFYVQLEEKVVADKEIELICTIGELHVSLSESEMIVIKRPRIWDAVLCDGSVWLVQSRRL